MNDTLYDRIVAACKEALEPLGLEGIVQEKRPTTTVPSVWVQFVVTGEPSRLLEMYRIEIYGWYSGHVDADSQWVTREINVALAKRVGKVAPIVGSGGIRDETLYGESAQPGTAVKLGGAFLTVANRADPV